MQTYYADRLGNINIAGGMARLDFLTVKGVENEGKQVQLEKSFRLVMPMDGIFQTIGLLEEMKQALMKQVEAEKSE